MCNIGKERRIVEVVGVPQDSPAPHEPAKAPKDPERETERKREPVPVPVRREGA